MGRHEPGQGKVPKIIKNMIFEEICHFPEFAPGASLNISKCSKSLSKVKERKGKARQQIFDIVQALTMRTGKRQAVFEDSQNRQEIVLRCNLPSTQ